MCGASDTAHLCQIGRQTGLKGTYGYRNLRGMDRLGIRVNLTLPASTVAVLDRIGAVTGAGRATLIREFLSEGEGAFAEMARALELASQKNVEAFDVLAKTMRDTTQKSEQLALDIKASKRRAMRRKKMAQK